MEGSPGRRSRGCAAAINFKTILDQTDVNGITATELIHEQINTLATDTDSTYTNQDFLNQYDPADFAAGTFTYFFESSLKTSAGTGYAQLYNRTNSTAITGSEVTTTGTAYTRVRSGDITANMPSAAKNLDTQLKNSAASGNTTSAASSWLIIQISSLQVPESLLFLLPLVIFLPKIFSKQGFNFSLVNFNFTVVDKMRRRKHTEYISLERKKG